MTFPRILIAGLAGGSGKTLVSLGLVRSFTLDGKKLKTFKKGPDYIDAAWLSLAAGTPQGNLDPFFSSKNELLQLFTENALGYDLCIIEGNRGIYDGLDALGSCSSAELSKILTAPVLLTINCTKMTRTVAALVAGCLNFDPAVPIAGVILNHTGSARQRNLIRDAIEHYTPVPVLGAIPRHGLAFIEERHLGLPKAENNARHLQMLDGIAKFIKENINMEMVLEIANSAPPICSPSAPQLQASATNHVITLTTKPATVEKLTKKSSAPVIAYVQDEAFWFYYAENLKYLENAGAQLIRISLLDNSPLPNIDGLYLSGSMPFDFAEEIENSPVKKEQIKQLIQNGLPVYAECGGLAYLCSELQNSDGKSYVMADVFPVKVKQEIHPKGLGYVEADVVEPNAFYPVKTRLRGHEFHFSSFSASDAMNSALHLTKGSGMGNSSDGLSLNNCFASCTHIYAPSIPQWANTFVDLCTAYHGKKT